MDATVQRGAASEKRKAVHDVLWKFNGHLFLMVLMDLDLKP